MIFKTKHKTILTRVSETKMGPIIIKVMFFFKTLKRRRYPQIKQIKIKKVTKTNQIHIRMIAINQ